MRASDLLQNALRHGNRGLDLISPYGARLQPKHSYLAGSTGFIFTWTFKAGAVLGYQRGHGIAIRRLAGGWSAPLWLHVNAGHAGVILGVEAVSTLLAALTQHPFQELAAGRHPIFGSDLSVRLWPIASQARRVPEQTLDLTTSDGGVPDLVATASGTGAIIDMSFSGGAITTDASRNATCYGPGTTASAILCGEVPAPEVLRPLYARIDSLLAEAQHAQHAQHAAAAAEQQMAAGGGGTQAVAFHAVTHHSGGFA